jgi:fructokinase
VNQEDGLRYGAIEAGGTKFVCGIGAGPDDLQKTEFPTTMPEQTVERAVAFFRGSGVRAIGIGSFGPVDLRPESSTFGHITSTPKLGWRDFDLAGAIGRAVGVPVAFDTDVNAAALGEARWGAGRGLSDFVYITIGTGIGGGAVVGGRLLHGLVHPEMGHIFLPHDRTRDPFEGVCPYHGDCFEGLAAGPAIQSRWNTPASMLSADHAGWALEANYIALGLANLVTTLSPQRFILGGGVMKQAQLFPLVRAELLRVLNGYVQSPVLLEAIDEYVVPPALEDRAGVLGAIALAAQSYT